MKVIANIYYWLWHDFLMRQEPFTYEFRRFKSAHPVIWWTGAAGFSGFWLWLILHVAQIGGL